MDIEAKLSDRENEIAEAVGFGLSRKEAANLFGITYKTVDNTIQNVFQKVGINKMTELTKFCFCRKFNIPLSMCTPAKRIVAAFCLSLFMFGEFVHASDYYRRANRIRKVQIEWSIRIRRIEK